MVSLILFVVIVVIVIVVVERMIIGLLCHRCLPKLCKGLRFAWNFENGFHVQHCRLNSLDLLL